MNALHALFRKCPRTLRLVFAAHLVILTTDASEEEVLYDVDFSGPPHKLHEPPVAGRAINLVSKVVFGSPEVVPEFGPLKDRPLLFRGREGYDQIRFDITPGWSKYRIEYDLVTSNLQNSRYNFGVSVDTPQVRNFDLHGGINKAYRFPGIMHDMLHQLWQDRQKSHYVIEVDIGQNTWNIWQDGIHLTTGPLNATEVRSVRFNLSPAYAGAPEDLSVVAALDNLKITGSVRYFPGPPTSLTTEGKNRFDGLSVYWPPVFLADSYRLYRSQTDDFETAEVLVETGEPRHVDTTAQLDKNYFYWVTTVRDDFESEASGSRSGLWETVPPAILSISKGERTDGIALFWTPGTPSPFYQVHRSPTIRFTDSSLLANTSQCSHLDTTAEPGKKYFYWITTAGVSLPENTSAGGYGVRGLLSVEGLVVTFDDKTRSFQLEWGGVIGANHYTIYRSLGGVFSSAEAIGRTPGLSFTDNSIALDKNYHYWVIPGTGETRDFAFAPGYEVTGHSQPDLWAQNSTDVPIGKGVINRTGAGQAIMMSTKTKRSLHGTVGIATLGAGSELVSLNASAGNRHFNVKYYLNGNVTAAMNAGTLKTPGGPEAQSVEVVVTPSGRPRGPSRAKALTLQIRGTSLVAREVSDLVILRATGNSKR